MCEDDRDKSGSVKLLCLLAKKPFAIKAKLKPNGVDRSNIISNLYRTIDIYIYIDFTSSHRHFRSIFVFSFSITVLRI